MYSLCILLQVYGETEIDVSLIGSSDRFPPLNPAPCRGKIPTKPIGADSTAARLTKIITKANFRHEGKGAASAAVSGAAIRITNFRTNTTVDTMSNETGADQVLFLLPSDYKVSVEQPGFNTGERAR